MRALKQFRQAFHVAKPHLWLAVASGISAILAFGFVAIGQTQSGTPSPQVAPGAPIVQLPTGQVLPATLPGNPLQVNSLPDAIAISPDRRYAVLLNNGFGALTSGGDQSLSVLDLRSGTLTDFPDPRFHDGARQTLFLGLAFSSDGARLYASVASISDPLGRDRGDLGNGIAVYSFNQGDIRPESFLPIPLQHLGLGKSFAPLGHDVPPEYAIPYPAGLAVVRVPAAGDSGGASADSLLVADQFSDDVLLMDAASGDILQRFDLSSHANVPSEYPYNVIATSDGARAYCSLWNASEVAELDLVNGGITRMISLLAPTDPIAPGSHPTAMALGAGDGELFVALANRDRVAVVDTATGRLTALLDTSPDPMATGGSTPDALAITGNADKLFVADAAANAVAVFDLRALGSASGPALLRPVGLIPTEWYPTAVGVANNELLIATDKGRGTGPNSIPLQHRGRRRYPYIAALLHGSLARVDLNQLPLLIGDYTREARRDDRFDVPLAVASPAARRIRHVIYIPKENRTYDQVLGDLPAGNGDASLVLFGQDVTPNEHKLALQFGVLDNFYCSGEVSGDGHQWLTAAATSDYNEKVWQVGYRGREHPYDYEGETENTIPLLNGIPDVDDPGTGFIWADAARHGVTYRHYGEFVTTEWCNRSRVVAATSGTSSAVAVQCPRAFVMKGDPLPDLQGRLTGPPSPWPWPVPILGRDVATKPQLRGHFDPYFADFETDYPDQLRADEFLREFADFVKQRNAGSDTMPQLIVLRLPNDHTGGTRPGHPTPAASVADNDLAVGRVIEAVSHSPYWNDTAFIITEDDAQDGADHVDAHRSPVFVVSKYSPATPGHAWVDHHFYTTVDLVRTIEALLDIPPMNDNDAHAAVMNELFSGPGTQPAFTADDRNLKNGGIYAVNPPRAPGAAASTAMDFSHADAADAHALNNILWLDRRGRPAPPPVHRYNFGH
jgi:DNA-binding beta-propeller fold protein YncE